MYDWLVGNDSDITEVKNLYKAYFRAYNLFADRMRLLYDGFINDMSVSQTYKLILDSRNSSLLPPRNATANEAAPRLSTIEEEYNRPM